jgi:hypothetical protein
MTIHRQRITGKAWKMNQQTKRFIATVGDAHARGELRRSLIAAQVASEVVVKSRAERESAEKK